MNTETFDADQPRTREEITAEYRQHHPILDAYLDIIERTNTSHSVNEPTAGGVSNDEAAGLALLRIGREPRDLHDVRHADAFIHHLLDEINAQCPKVDEPITEYVIRAQYPLGGCVDTAEAWLARDEDDRDFGLDEIILGIPADELRRVLKEALAFAMPAILRKITEDDQRRRRGGLRSVEGTP